MVVVVTHCVLFFNQKMYHFRGDTTNEINNNYKYSIYQRYEILDYRLLNIYQI